MNTFVAVFLRYLSSHRANPSPRLRVVPPSHQHLLPALRSAASTTTAAAAGTLVILRVPSQPPYGRYVAKRVRQTALWAGEQEGLE